MQRLHDDLTRERRYAPAPRRPYTIDERAAWVRQAMEAGESKPENIWRWILLYVNPDDELLLRDVFNALNTRPEWFIRVECGIWELVEGQR